MTVLSWILVMLFIGVQITYLLAMLIDVYFYTRPVDRVDMSRLADIPPDEYPHIVLFYPVLHELEETMRTTFCALARMDYPSDKYDVIAIPNHDDPDTIASLRRLQQEFAFMQILEVPATTDPGWQVVWDTWDTDRHAYWYHSGATAGIRNLPPKKTRQLIYAFYNVWQQRRGSGDFLVNYIDADSAPPRDHFKAGAVGIRQFDVLQATNIAGNLMHSLPASWFAFDHIVWDANKYGRLTAGGRHPFWVLGKGLFFKASDLHTYGGFNPWITIEDPEVGMRLWKNGKTLGLIEAPLVEEVPETLAGGITQRKRWIAGFFQSLDTPLREMGFTRLERIKAWMNFLPCLSLTFNAIGIPISIWALVLWWQGSSPVPLWAVWLAGVNALALTVMLLRFYWVAWVKTRIVIPSVLLRLAYLFRVNPLFLLVFWFIWTIPLWLGWRMYLKNTGLVWERTKKINANNDMIRHPG
ncbi:MAG: glycosyltransferase family 2 protein [Ottowia sp.]